MKKMTFLELLEYIESSKEPPKKIAFRGTVHEYISISKNLKKNGYEYTGELDGWYDDLLDHMSLQLAFSDLLTSKEFEVIEDDLCVCSIV